MSSSSLKQAKTEAFDIPALCIGWMQTLSLFYSVYGRSIFIIAIFLEDSQRVLRGHVDEGKVKVGEASQAVN